MAIKQGDMVVETIHAIQLNDFIKVRSALDAGVLFDVDGTNFDIMRYALKNQTDLAIFNAVCDKFISQLNACGFEPYNIMYDISDLFRFGIKNKPNIDAEFSKIPLFLDKCIKSNLVGAIRFAAFFCYFYDHANFNSKLKILPPSHQKQICLGVFECVLKHNNSFPYLDVNIKHMINLFATSKYGFTTVNSHGETLLLMAQKANHKKLIANLISLEAEQNKKILEKELSKILSTKGNTTKKVM